VRALLWPLLLALSAPAAEPPVPVSELVSTLTCALATDRDDQRIARSLETTRLSERLSEETVGTLEQAGVGPATALALQALRKQSAALPAPPEDPISFAPAPSAAERARMLDAVRLWSGAYLASLPDFTCTRTVHQFRDRTHAHLPTCWAGSPTKPAIPPAGTHWSAAGSFAGEVAYVAGRDHFRVTLVNNQPFSGSLEQLGRDHAWGEFGGLMLEIMDPRRNAAFQWDRWEMLHRRRMAVFRYAVDLAHSHYSLRVPLAHRRGSESQSWIFPAAHHGFIYVDPLTGVIERSILYADGLDCSTPLSAAGDVVDYGAIRIGDASFQLPIAAVAYERALQTETREEIEYRDYRKFQSDSTVKFDGR
jgi:hypothetical protein